MPHVSNFVTQLEKLQCVRRVMQHKAAEEFSLYRGQWPVLQYIRRNPGCTQVEIAQTLLITPSSIAQSTSRMQRDGLLEKQPQSGDRRSNCLRLTGKGAAVSEECGRRYYEIDRDIAAGFSQEEMRTLEDMLGRMVHNAAQRASLDVEHLDFEAFMRLKQQLYSKMSEEIEE